MAWLLGALVALAGALVGCDAGASSSGPVAAPVAPLARGEDGAGGGGGAGGSDGSGAAGGGSCQVQPCGVDFCGCGRTCQQVPCPEVGGCWDADEGVCLCEHPGRCVDEQRSCDTNADCGTDRDYVCSADHVCRPKNCTSSQDCPLRNGVHLTCQADGVCGEPLGAGAEPTFACAQGAPGGRGDRGGALAVLALAGAALWKRGRR